MVSADAKMLARARNRQKVASAKATSSAFNQKQSAFARRSEEDLIRSSEDANTPFANVQQRNASRPGSFSMGGMKDTTRRNAKFHLNDDSQAAPASREKELGSLLGLVAPPKGPVEDDEADAKDLKRRRFEDVISTSRKSRIEIQREREERHKATDELDAQFDELLPLLPKRDKRQEDVDRFAGLARPDVQALLNEKDQHKTAKGGRRFAIGDDGNLVRVDAEVSEETPDAAALQNMERLAAMLPSRQKQPATATPAPVVATEAAPADDFDAMLGTFRMELKRAHAGERVLLPEEEAARDIQLQLLQMDREQRPDAKQHADRTRGEWVEAGGDKAYRMEDEDEGVEHHPVRPGERATQAVDEVLGSIEEMCSNSPNTSVEVRSKLLAKHASDLWHAAVKQKKHAEDSFKLLLVDAQRRFSKGLPLSRFHRILLLLATKVFPTTDFRHPVTTPLMILLSNLCIATKLNTVASCAHALWCASVLAHSLAPSKRFASEVVATALNVIAMQLPRTAVVAAAFATEPVLFPTMERCVEPILTTGDVAHDVIPEPLRALMIDGAEFDASYVDQRGEEALRLDTLAAGYRLLLNAADLYKESPSFESIFGASFVRSLAVLCNEVKMHPSIKELHHKSVERIATLIASTAMERTPLAMRSFRPRPLRQYEPMMIDDTPTVKKELQELKKELSADHRRVMRTLQAEARVEQRTRDATQSVVDARKKDKLDSLMAELQQQQHIMKTSDSLRTKAAGKKRDAKNVVPKAGAGKSASD